MVGGSLRRVQAHKPGISAFDPVHRACSQAHDQAEHPGIRIQGREKTVWAVGVSDAGRAGHEILPEMGTGYAHDQDCHFLIPFRQCPPPAVVQGGERHGAGIDSTDSFFKGQKPLFPGSEVRYEHRIIFSGKRIFKAIFQDAAGTDDYGLLPIIIQKMKKLLLNLRPEGALPDRVVKLPGEGKIPVFGPLADGKLPQVIFHQITGIHVRTDIKGVMCLHIVVQLRLQILDDLARRQHAA